MLDWSTWTVFAGGCATVAAVASVARRRRSRLNLTHLLLVSFGLTYGAAVLVATWSSRAAVYSWLKGPPQYVLLTLAIVFSFLLAAITVYLWELLFPGASHETRLKTVLSCAQRVTARQELIPLAVIVFITAYGAVRYGLVGHLSARGNNAIALIQERQIPYWYTSIRQILSPILFALVIISSSRVAGDGNAGSESQLRRIVLVLILLGVAFVFGRRTVMYTLVILGIGAAYRWKSILTMRTVIAAILALAAIVSISNMYQFYRDRIGLVTVSTVLQHWDDFSLTQKNLNIRRPDFVGAYLGLYGNEEAGVLNGAILRQDLANNVPEFVDPGKVYRNVDQVVTSHYGWEHVDLPDTPSMMMLSDWGPLIGLFVGIILYLFGVLWPYTVFVRAFRGQVLMNTFAAGGLVYLLINVEVDIYSVMFTYWKYLILMGALAGVMHGTKLMLKRHPSRHLARKKRYRVGRLRY